jgi:FixJ family two-component response regulator
VNKENPLPMVYVVDNDESVRKALKRLIISADMRAEGFASMEEFIQSGFQDKPGCLVTDIDMLGGTGFALKSYLADLGHTMPVIFITAHDNKITREKVDMAGAAAYFPKPFDDLVFLNAIKKACKC